MIGDALGYVLLADVVRHSARVSGGVRGGAIAAGTGVVEGGAVASIQVNVSSTDVGACVIFRKAPLISGRQRDRVRVDGLIASLGRSQASEDRGEQ